MRNYEKRSEIKTWLLMGYYTLDLGFFLSCEIAKREKSLEHKKLFG
jgi:hypothetical protein